MELPPNILPENRKILTKSDFSSKIWLRTQCVAGNIYKNFTFPRQLCSDNIWSRCWWRMLLTKCVDYNYKMLVTVLAFLVIKIRYLFTEPSGTNIQQCHQHRIYVINIFKSSRTLSHRHCDVSEITVNQMRLNVFGTSKFPGNNLWNLPRVHTN